MARWLALAILIAALYRIARAAVWRRESDPPPPRRFDPGDLAGRANSRAAEPLSTHAIEDADYEELPGGGR